MWLSININRRAVTTLKSRPSPSRKFFYVRAFTRMFKNSRLFTVKYTHRHLYGLWQLWIWLEQSLNSYLRILAHMGCIQEWESVGGLMPKTLHFLLLHHLIAAWYGQLKLAYWSFYFMAMFTCGRHCCVVLPWLPEYWQVCSPLYRFAHRIHTRKRVRLNHVRLGSCHCDRDPTPHRKW